MAFRRGGGSRRFSKTIDFKQWTSIPTVRSTLTADSTLLGGSLAFAVPATILRVRGYVSGQFDSTKQVGDRIDLTWGFAVLSTDAVSAGPTVLPDPGDEPNYPWLWWMDMDLESHIAAGEEAWGTTAQRYEVDSKAMRKVKPGESLVGLVQARGAAGAPVTIVHFGETRVLIGT